ncbi:MAG: hypothetical protein ABW174_11025 [Flavitalea sp.]
MIHEINAMEKLNEIYFTIIYKKSILTDFVSQRLVSVFPEIAQAVAPANLVDYSIDFLP